MSEIIGSEATGSSYVFEYDERGRVVRINDELFYYGNTGRLDYSRIGLRSVFNGKAQELIVRKSYHWDDQRRLKHISLDSLYSNNFPIPGKTGKDTEISLLKDVLLCTYSYAPGMSKPNHVVYKKWNGPFGEIGEEYQEMYQYQGDNIEQMRSFFELALFPPTLGMREKFRGTVYSFYQYSTTKDPLYSIYEQMGFNPIKMNKVVSKNLPQAFFGNLFEGHIVKDVKPDWTKKIDIKVDLGSDGWPISSYSVLKATFEGGHEAVFGEILSEYVYE